MCGDGANDCGALKAANTGISLSEAESSVASPFTSSEANIRCVPTVIREGRAALTTSFGVFKFMVAYALTEFASVIILYGIDTNLTDMQFLFIDICLVVNFATFFGKTNAYNGKMVKTPPASSLLGVTPLVSLLVFMVAAIFFQYLAFYLIQTYEWFEPFNFDENNTIFYVSYENFAVYSISLSQYIGMAIVFSKGKPFRMPIFTNFALTCSLILMIIVCTYIVMYPAKWVVDILELRMPLTYDFRIILIGLGSVNFVISLFLESFLVEFVVHKKLKPFFHNVEKSRKKYIKINRDIKTEKWPKFSKNTVHVNVGFIDEKDSENIITKL